MTGLAGVHNRRLYRPRWPGRRPGSERRTNQPLAASTLVRTCPTMTSATASTMLQPRRLPSTLRSASRTSISITDSRTDIDARDGGDAPTSTASGQPDRVRIRVPHSIRQRLPRNVRDVPISSAASASSSSKIRDPAAPPTARPSHRRQGHGRRRPGRNWSENQAAAVTTLAAVTSGAQTVHVRVTEIYFKGAKLVGSSLLIHRLGHLTDRSDLQASLITLFAGRVGKGLKLTGA